MYITKAPVAWRTYGVVGVSRSARLSALPHPAAAALLRVHVLRVRRPGPHAFALRGLPAQRARLLDHVLHTAARRPRRGGPGLQSDLGHDDRPVRTDERPAHFLRRRSRRAGRL